MCPVWQGFMIRKHSSDKFCYFESAPKDEVTVRSARKLEVNLKILV